MNPLIRNRRPLEHQPKLYIREKENREKKKLKGDSDLSIIIEKTDYLRESCVAMEDSG